ncbi:MAG: ornithine carbamoyltransferase [Chitinivibrionales bacterium]|nr:ornithine carbamoyltransferase [Chitinivibrionales bacterium]
MAQPHKDLLTLLDYTGDQIGEILSIAQNLKKDRLQREPDILRGKTGVLIFEKPSLRTRITFETALNELGGHAINLESRMVQLGKRETVDDVARNLERWVHLIIARTYLHSTVVQLARACSIPVVNALTDYYHPCQALAFALTLREHRGEDGSGTIVFIGDGNNVCSSLMALAMQLGYNFTLACPKGYEPPQTIVAACLEIAKKKNCTLSITQDLLQAVKNATVIYTDVWTSMGQENEATDRERIFNGYQVNTELLSRAPGDVLVSHCLPAHRGQEITSEILDSAQSIALDEAENRLHVQKAVIQYLLS